MSPVDTDAKKLFLAEFRNGTDIKWLDDKNYYKSQIYSSHFGDIKRQFETLRKNGLVEKMSPAQIVSHNLKLTELKDECKKRGLKVSGKKDDLVARLLEADPNFIDRCKNKNGLWICSSTGLEIVNAYYSEEKQREEYLKEKVFSLIRSREYKTAALEVEIYRNRKVFTDWMGAGHLSLAGEADKIKTICENIPNGLNRLDEFSLEKARLLVSYDMLRGTNEIRKFQSEPTNVPELSIGTAMTILMNYACFREDLKEWKKSKVVTGVQIIGDGLCPECQKICGIYTWKDQIPEIPNPKCQNSDPCRPLWLAVTMGMTPVKDEPKRVEIIPQKKEQKKKSFFDFLRRKH